MRGQGFWVAVVGRETYEAESLYANETIAIEPLAADPGHADSGHADPGRADSGAVDSGAVDSGVVDSGLVDSGVAGSGQADRIGAGAVASVPRPGDPVALVAAADERLLFGLGVVTAERGYPRVRYTHRLFDDPRPVERAGAAGGLFAVTEAEFARLTEGIGAQHRVDRDRAEWFVSVALPIEASSRAEAVREFWSYVDKLGPRELPAFVWPRGDELAMQAYLLGEETNLDPESDDD